MTCKGSYNFGLRWWKKSFCLARCFACFACARLAHKKPVRHISSGYLRTPLGKRVLKQPIDFLDTSVYGFLNGEHLCFLSEDESVFTIWTYYSNKTIKS